MKRSSKKSEFYAPVYDPDFYKQMGFSEEYPFLPEIRNELNQLVGKGGIVELSFDIQDWFVRKTKRRLDWREVRRAAEKVQNALQSLSIGLRELPETVFFDYGHMPGQESTTKLKIFTAIDALNNGLKPVLIEINKGKLKAGRRNVRWQNELAITAFNVVTWKWNASLKARALATIRVIELCIRQLMADGYVWGHPRMYRPLNSVLALGTGANVFTPEYRLAPEHPLPAARDDALAGYRWLLRCGVQSGRMIVAGESAGGGLTLTLLLALRDAGEPLPAGAVCLSPWTDLACTGVSLAANDRSCAMLHAATIRSAARLALGNLMPTDPSASPLYGDFRGLPPLLIVVSEDETLLDDTLRVADRASAHGVDVTLRTACGVPHAWPYYQGIIPEAQEAALTIVAFMRDCWERAESKS